MEHIYFDGKYTDRTAYDGEVIVRRGCVNGKSKYKYRVEGKLNWYPWWTTKDVVEKYLKQRGTPVKIHVR